MKGSLTELKRRVRGKKLAAIGFCFGGNMVWRLVTSNEPRLAAAAPFYGPFPEGGSFAGNRAAVLGVYGGLDARVNATRAAAKAALDAARRKYVAPHVHRGRPRLLQRHRGALQPARRDGGLAPSAELVRRRQ